MAAEGFSFTSEIEAQQRAELRYAQELVGEAEPVDEERGAAGETAEAPAGGEDVVIEVRSHFSVAGARPRATLTASPQDEYPVELARQRERIQAVDFEPRVFSRPRLRNLNEFAPDETLMQLEMVNRVQADRILMIWIGNLAQVLNQVQIKQLGTQLSKFKNAQVLGLQNAGVTSLDRFNLPRLLFCDLSENRIRQLSTLEAFCSRSPFLQALNVMGNPVAQTSKWHNALPERTSPAWRLLLHMPDLTVLNNEHLSVSWHLAAAQMKGATPEHLERARVMEFGAALSARVDLSAMDRWDPASIRVLNLGECELTTFHVKPFRNLVLLDLSHNSLTTLSGCGLEFCERLEAMSLTGNPLRKNLDLAPLTFLYSLRVLLMDSTPFYTVKNYRLRVIYATRNLRGTDKCGGLQKLDNDPITLDERIQALATVGKAKKAELPSHRWQMALRLQFGNAQMAREDFGSSIRELVMPDLNLAEVDVTPFKDTLEVLRMPGNALRGAGPTGLRQLSKLRVLDIGCNRGIKPDRVLRELTAAPLTELRRVDFAPDPEKVTEKKWFRWVVALVPHNSYLTAVQGRVPTFAERVEGAKKPPLSLSGAALEQYRLELAITCSATPPSDRAYLPADCKPDVQFRPRDVRELLRLAGLGLVDGVLNLAPFEGLEKLNLAGNKLRDVSDVGLEKLPRLRLLDLRDNQLRTKPSALGRLFNGMPALEAVAVRGNPVTKRLQRARIEIIGSMPRMGEVECELRVIDSEVTVSERVEALRKAGKGKDEAEKLRANIALRLRTPRGAEPASVRTLNLDDMELYSIDLSAYTELRVLRLRGNMLRVLHGLGLEHMPNLLAFDARDNPLDTRVPDNLVDPLRGAHGLRFLGLAPSNLSASQRRAFRSSVIQALPRLRKVDCPLSYLDEEEIAPDEIVDAMRDKSEDEKEDFRFQLVIHRVLEGRAPGEVEELDLSGRNLGRVDMGAFTSLRRLSLGHNRLRSRALQGAGLDTLPHLEELDLSHNAFTNIKALGRELNELRHLKTLFVEGNKCFREDGVQEREQLLGAMRRSRKRGFHLQFLNRVGISVDERCRGMAASGLERKKVERLRLDLTLEELGVDRATCTSLDLCNRDIADCALLGYYAQSQGDFANLVSLDLSQNKLKTLDGMRLHLLPNLARLDLRENSINDLSSAVSALELCPKLEVVLLHNCTEGEEASDPNVYVEEVCRRLRSVRIVDEIENPDPLEYTESRAAEYLFKICGVSPNSLVDVDLRGRGLSANCFFFVLAALRELQPRSVRLNNNDWDNTGVGPQSHHYRQYVIALLEERAAAGTGRRLQEVDGHVITDDERDAALGFLSKEEKAFGEETNVYRIMRGEWDSARFETTALQNSEMDRRRRIAKEAAKVRGKRGPGVGDHGKNVNRAKATAAEKGVGDKAGGATRGAQNAVGSAADDVIRLAPKATGTLLNKFELLIGFFQIYGLVLAITFDYDIPFPDIWVDLARYYNWIPQLLSVDVDAIFTRLDLQLGEYETVIKFIGAISVYVIFMLLYWVGAALDRDAWISSYVTNWRSTWCKAAATYFLTLLASFGVGLLLDTRSVDNLGNGNAPTGNTNTVTATLALIFTGVFLMWNIVVRTFRRKFYKHRASAAFTKFWSRSKRNVQRASLFALTIGYMPVARMILTNFAGTYEPDALDTSGCVYADSSGRRCCLTAFPGRPCVSSPAAALHWLQYVSLVSAVVIVVGLPLFFVYLIRKGVEAVDVAGYEQAESRFQTRLEVLDATLKSKKAGLRKAKKEGRPADAAAFRREVKAMQQSIKETKADRRNTYAYEVGKNPKAQSYLYQAYQRKSRFVKILQMVEKLALVCIALYVPARILKESKVLVSTSVVGAAALTSGVLRPFNDGFEDIIDLVSRVANTVNIGVSLGLNTGHITDWLASILLIGFNGANVGMFAFSVIITPIRACLARRRFLKDMARAKEAAQRRSANLSTGGSASSGQSMQESEGGGDGEAKSQGPGEGGSGSGDGGDGGQSQEQGGDSGAGEDSDQTAEGGGGEEAKGQEGGQTEEGGADTAAAQEGAGAEAKTQEGGGGAGADGSDGDSGDIGGSGLSVGQVAGVTAGGAVGARIAAQQGALRAAKGSSSDVDSKGSSSQAQAAAQASSREDSQVLDDVRQSLALAQGTLDGSTKGLGTVPEVTSPDADNDSMDGDFEGDDDDDAGDGSGSENEGSASSGTRK